MVVYQPGYRDAFYHRYSYDAENRLTLAETSSDSLVWEKDARYEYYRHGSLARVTLGEQQVQGLDYAYTLQGWLKGINSTGGTDSFDMGGDGRYSGLNRYTARDAIGLTLNYFGNDYAAINGMPFPGYSGFLSNLSTDAYRPLYNGNISSSSVYQKKFEGEPGGPLIFYNYKYDQLNRLTAQDTYNGFLAAQNKWDNMRSMGESAKERVAYDANGNIQTYLRKSIQGGIMDSLKYHYYANTNQLRHITDGVPANGYVHNNGFIVDIDNQADSNYVYDAIGNLIKDSAEKITDIKWNVYGKIAEITRLATGTVPASNIKYTYDAMGNRIGQVVASNGTKHYTWYVRDAQGNILSTYTADGNDANLENLKLNLADRFMYGSSRLGTIAVNDDNVDDGPGSTEYFYEGRNLAYGRGYKNYELTNHLGNVLATVSDRKFGVSSAGSSLIDHYEPHIVTAQDYYPFGMLSRVSLPGNDKSYAFGFNGKMNDNDVKGGLGNQQDYGMRIYDPRIGKFLSVDPLTKDYPWYTPYQFAGNKPIRYIDLDGLEEAEGIFTKIGTYGPNAVNTIGWGDVKATFWSGVDFFNRKVSPVGIAAHGIYATSTAEDLVTGEKRNQLTSFTDMGVDLLTIFSGGRFVSGLSTTTKLETQIAKNSTAVRNAEKAAAQGEAATIKKSTASTASKQAASATGARARYPVPDKRASFAKDQSYYGLEFLDDGFRMVEQPLKTATPLSKNSIIEGYKVSNHAWRKSGLGRGVTEELISSVITNSRQAGTIVPEVGTGKFAGNVINVYSHDGIKVAVDENRKLILSARPERGFHIP